MKRIKNEIKTINNLTIDRVQQFSEVLNIIKNVKNNVMHLANKALIDLYWQIGEYISRQIESAAWGNGVVVQLALYIEKNYPDMKGFSDKNLWRMKQFYEIYKDSEKLSPLVRELTWTNNLIIMSRAKTENERMFYMQKCISEQYSKRELERQISSALYERSLAEPQISAVMKNVSQKTSDIFRDQYVFEFLGAKEFEDENSMKNALLAKMKKFILELGKDFLFIDQEYHLQVGNSDFRIDLLFYHRELQCLVAFELKTDQFRPEYLGKLNFYLEALDRDVKKPKENPSIGVLLCKDKDDEVVEYALSRSLSPTMVAEYKFHLPDKKILKQKLHEIIEFRTPFSR